MNRILDEAPTLGELPVVWRKTIKVLLGRVVGLERIAEDGRVATDEAADIVLADYPELRESLLDQRLANLRAKQVEFDAMHGMEFDARVKTALNDALISAIQSIEKEDLESMPAS